MMTAAGVHEEIEKVLVNTYPPTARKKLKVLDMGAGKGALSQRIYDLGFSDISAWDINTKQFQPRKIPITAVNLDEDFVKKDKGKYDLITASEIIEHLENPYKFMRQASSLLKPKGILLISTPNIESAFSRYQFLFKGEFIWFDNFAFQEWGHITPIGQWKMNLLAKKAGLIITAKSQNRPSFILRYVSLVKGLIKHPTIIFTYFFMKGNRKGDVTIWKMSLDKTKKV